MKETQIANGRNTGNQHKNE